MTVYRMRHIAATMHVNKPVLTVYTIRMLTSESVCRKPERLFASMIHNADVIMASATTSPPKAKYSKYDTLEYLEYVLYLIPKPVKADRRN